MNPYLIILLAPLFWAGNFVVGRAIAGQIEPVELAHWRWAFPYPQRLQWPPTS